VRLSVEIIVFAMVYAGAAKLGLKMDAVSGMATLVWPPTGIALVVLMRRGLRLWPGVVLGVFLLNAWNGFIGVAAFGIAFGNTLEAVFGAWVARRLVGRNEVPERLTHVLGLLLFVAFGSTLISASIGTVSLALAGLIPRNQVLPAAGTWWLGDATADIVLAPLLLAWSFRPHTLLRGLRRPLRVVEALALGVCFTALLHALFLRPLGSERALVQPTMILPFLIWASVRFGLRGATAVTFLASAVAIWGTAAGRGPFVHEGLTPSLLFLQVFTAVVSITTQVLAVAIGQRDSAVRAAETAALKERVARHRAELLAEVSELLSSVFEYPRVLSELTRLCVRSLADWALIDVLEGGSLRRRAGAHRQAELEATLRELETRYPASSTANAPAAQAIAQGPVFLPEISEADIRTKAKDAAHAELLLRLGTASAIAVPLDARGEIFGALTLSSATRGHYKAPDLELARELGRRAALAIDNARLLQAEKVALARLARVALAVRDMANTPLQTMSLSVELLRAKQGKGDEVVSRMMRAIERLSRLDDLLSAYSEQFVLHDDSMSFDAEAILESAGMRRKSARRSNDPPSS
jgi:integral membrane sensor domain MASE1